MTDDLRPTLSSLGAKVKDLAERLEQHLKDNDVAAPTLAADSPINISKHTSEIFLTKQLLADALSDLAIVSQGPSESVFNYCHNVIPDVAALNIMNHFDFWSAVPIDGSASMEEIAKHTSLPEEAVQRVVEHATTLRYFAYTDPASPSTSRIQHTSRSAALLQSAGLRALVLATIQDIGPSMLVMPSALEKYSQGKPTLTNDINETSFALSHSGGMFGEYKDVWDYLENDGEGKQKGWRQRNFNVWMDYIKDIFGTNEVLLHAFDWKSVGNATVVDLGGSGGHDTFVLAKAFPQLNVVVQDLPECQPVFDKNLPSSLESRVSFLPHNFFNPQPVQADIYLIKLILHDWPDKQCIEILQGLRPALKRGAKIVFIDYVGKPSESETNLPRSMHQFGTSTDLRMMALFNAKERPVAFWEGIFARADERFKVQRIECKALSYMVVIEAVWDGE